MNKVFSIVFGSILMTLVSCGDGDVIEANFEFDQELGFCLGPNGENFIVFDTRLEPFESLTLVIPNTTDSQLIFNPTEPDASGTLAINTSTRFNYRTYSGDPNDIICQAIPSSQVAITGDFESPGGTIEYTTTFIDTVDTRTVTIIFTLLNIDVEVFRADEFNFGTLTLSLSL